MTYPRNFSHIGITVTDLDKAVEFYTKVMGWYLIMPATTITEDDSAIGVMCNDVFGPGWGSFRIAHLSTGDDVPLFDRGIQHASDLRAHRMDAGSVRGRRVNHFGHHVADCHHLPGLRQENQHTWHWGTQGLGACKGCGYTRQGR